MRMKRKGVMNTREKLFQTYLPEFLWMRKFQLSDPFIKLYQHIKEQYPL